MKQLKDIETRKRVKILVVNIIEKQNKHSIENIQQKNELYLIIDKIIKTINEKKTENQLNELYKFIPKMNNNSKVELLVLFIN